MSDGASRSPRKGWAMRQVMVLLLMLLLAACAGRPAPVATGGAFLSASDPHFDPMADAALVPALQTAPALRWAAILDRAPAAPLGRYGEDPGWPLVRSALDAMRATLPDPAFLVLPGDFLAHSFRQKFDATAPDRSDAAYSSFVTKTFAFLADELRRRFPGATIFPALGNNDSVCGDYRLRPDGAFLAATLPIVHALTHTGPSADFDADWSRLGQYDLPVPGIAHQRMIFVNTVYFSTEYKDACAPPGAADPAPAVLHWLAAHLARARAAGDHVWLLMHIPPGIDVYATLHGDTAPKIETMWREDDAAGFASLARQYAATITMSFAGHTHMDEFRLIDGAGSVLVTPAISPIFGQNPGFETWHYGPDGTILDRATSVLDSLQAGGWRQEYDFDATWGTQRLDADSLRALAEQLGTDQEAATRWLSLYPLSRAAFWKPTLAAQPPAVVGAYLCSAAHTDVAAFRSCAGEERQGLRP